MLNRADAERGVCTLNQADAERERERCVHMLNRADAERERERCVRALNRADAERERCVRVGKETPRARAAVRFRCII